MSPPQLCVCAILNFWGSYLPAIGRFLIVVTFLEDALRIVTQWGDQLSYLNNHRHSAFTFAPPSPRPRRPRPRSRPRRLLGLLVR